MLSPVILASLRCKGRTGIAATREYHGAMPSNPLRALGALLGCACAALTLAACGGSQTRTVTAASAPEPTETAGASAQATTAPSTPAKTTTATTSSAQTSTTAAPSSTRTAPEPAIAEHEASAEGEGLNAAVATVQAHGYTASETSQYHPNQTLRVLVGTKSGSGDGYDQQAFFFLGSRYLGTDTKQPSATVTVVSQGDTEVTLEYPLYRRGEQLSSPSGQATVRFQLNDGKLTALDPIPPASSASSPSRY